MVSIIRTNQRLRCEMRVEKIIDYARATSAAAAAAAAARCVCSILNGSHAKAVNRRHRGAMCSVYVGRAVRCGCVDPEPTARRLLFR